MRRAVLLLALTVAGAGVARAEDACAAFKWPVSREVRAFAAELPVMQPGSAYPAPGTAVALALAPQASVGYTVRPKRAPKSSPAYGTEVTGTIAQAGTYQATLSADAWIDVAQNGAVLRSTAFSGKEGCAAVRKSVRFALQPGPVTIAISDAPASSLKLDIVQAE